MTLEEFKANLADPDCIEDKKGENPFIRFESKKGMFFEVGAIYYNEYGVLIIELD